MSTPAYPHFPPPLSTQDFKDDDAQVIDDLVKTTSAPADPNGAVVPTENVPQYKPKAVTRLNANTVQFSQAQQAVTPYQAIRLLSEDVDRGTTKIRAYSSAATPGLADYALIADDLGKISGGALGICIVIRSGGVVDLDGHTGQLWVIPGPSLTAASTFEVSAYGITSIDGTVMNNV